MKNVLVIISAVILVFSCSKSETLISKDGVGKIRLGEALNSKYDKTSLDITLNDEEQIRTIIISNSKYKTIDAFCVGTDFKNILAKYDQLVINENFNASKGKYSFMKLGKSITYQNIIFVDSDGNNTVDYIILENN